jgi:serine/threonine kinase 3
VLFLIALYCSNGGQKDTKNLNKMSFVTEEDQRKDPHLVFDLLEKFGEGSYGTVYKARHKPTGKVCAIKKIPVENDLEDTIREINIMTGFASDYLVRFYASYLTNDSLWV